MNSGGAREPEDELLACPTLCEWTAGGAYPGLAADEIRVWLIELDAGLASDAEIETSRARAGAGLAGSRTSGGGLRGSCGRAIAGGSFAAGPRCERSWAGCWGARRRAPVSGGDGQTGAGSR